MFAPKRKYSELLGLPGRLSSRAMSAPDGSPNRPPPSRRRFLHASGATAWSAAIGLPVVFARNLPAGIEPIGLDLQDPDGLPQKSGLTILNDRPINAETPAHLLDDEVTPAERLFVRNNGHPPARASIDPTAWSLKIGGESIERPTSFTIAELGERFDEVTLQLTIECGGNGRSEFQPPATGNQWTVGAVGCPRWTGVRLRDVLESCGVRDDAVYIGYHGADTHLSGDAGKEAISRGVPIAKAMEPETLIAWAVNGRAMPWLNGHPLRLVCGGWPASTCGKWLVGIDVRDREHDGAKMGGKSYRVPRHPVAPGSRVPDSDMRIIEAMPIKSLITRPRSGVTASTVEPLSVRGHAWVGDGRVDRVDLSIDFGATWTRADLKAPVNRLAWQHWSGAVSFPGPGYYEVWARATDDAGRSQPMLVPGWNPKGYLNNACHRIAVQVQA